MNEMALKLAVRYLDPESVTDRTGEPSAVRCARNKDQEDMRRLGKVQVYKRNFRFLATLGFAMVFSSTWEYVLVATSSGLINGGFGGLVWEYVWTFAGYSTIVVSLAEMSSMAPTAGGQYHCMFVEALSPVRNKTEKLVDRGI